jgi:hypothetical protein
MYNNKIERMEEKKTGKGGESEAIARLAPRLDPFIVVYDFLFPGI